MVPVTRRRHLHRSMGFAAAGARVAQRLGRVLTDVEHLELYSCFPVAVRVQMRELGIPASRVPSVTGGMTFAGGPLNNFVFQAMARMAQVLRADPGSVGVVTAVSGMLTKQGVSAWSTEPPPAGFRFDDVTEDVARATAVVDVVADAAGPATVVSYTVLYDPTGAGRAVVLCATDDGRRTLGVGDAALADVATREELCGRRVRIAAGAVTLA
jgi:acetyl-CoA C-acetyltransferase